MPLPQGRATMSLSNVSLNLNLSPHFPLAQGWHKCHAKYWLKHPSCRPPSPAHYQEWEGRNQVHYLGRRKAPEAPDSVITNPLEEMTSWNHSKHMRKFAVFSSSLMCTAQRPHQARDCSLHRPDHGEALGEMLALSPPSFWALGQVNYFKYMQGLSVSMVTALRTVTMSITEMVKS